MILKSITVRNYRIHRESRVDLDPSRTVIGGPNESGKSTLIESAHRALFLKAKITGSAQKRMVRWNGLGHPEVEVEFEIGNSTYRISKRFSGQSGTARLTEIGGGTWQGEEAEERLAALLGIQDGQGGHGAGRVASQWAHIWVWQGQAGGDPSEHAQDHRDELMARLQRTGGAAVLQSDLDARVAGVIEQQFTDEFTQGGAPKKNSTLQRANEDLEEAARLLSDAQAASGRLEAASAELLAAQEALRLVDGVLPGLQQELVAAQGRARRADLLRPECERMTRLVESASDRHRDLSAADERIRSILGEVDEHEKRLAPRLDALKVSEARVGESETAVNALDVARRAATEQARGLRRSLDMLRSFVRFFQSEKQKVDLESKESEIQQLQAELEKVETQLRLLPLIKPALMKKLEGLERELGEARATLEGMATGLEVLSTDQVILVDGEPLTEGTLRILTDEAELSLGENTRIRIRPGGGTTLAEARLKLEQAKADLDDLYGSLGVKSVAEAHDARTRRSEVESDKKERLARLDNRGADTIQKELSDAREKYELAQGEVARARELQDATFAPPSELAEARARMEAFELGVTEANNRESVADAAWTAQREVHDTLVAERDGSREKLKMEHVEFEKLRTQLQVLRETNGDDESRTERLRQILEEKKVAETNLADQQRSLADLQPELIESDLSRLGRALGETQSTQREAGTQEAVARSILRSDGTTDPASAVAMATETARRTQAAYDRASRDAAALRMLRELFVEEQRRLAEQFTVPLAERISDYLRCMYGAGARARLAVDGNSFSGIEIVRRDHGDQAMPFEPLSGGTKEQVAVAVRLAIAEILAEDHEGRLPVVLDDAFAYSDRERVKNVQRMLDLAAARRLQVIVLTCTPEDYAGLGAKVVTLKPPAFTAPRYLVGGEDESDAASKADLTHDDEGSRIIAADILVTEERRMALRELLDPGQAKGNITLRQQLGWNDELYKAIKDDLIRTGDAMPGQGRGGSLRAGK